MFLKLNKLTNDISKLTGLSVLSCRLIGEFAAFETSLQKGDFFSEYKVGGRTYIRRNENNNVYFCLGENCCVKLWKIEKRTPQSYVVKYVSTLVIIRTFQDMLYKFFIVESQHENKIKRVFPFRRNAKYMSQDIGPILQCESVFIPQNNIKQELGNFIITEEIEV